MGLVTVVRHGQASSFGKTYHQLSDTGQRQSRLLGEYWVDRGIVWDRVLVGPRLRHRETEERVACAYRACGLPWPEAEVLPALDEIEMAKLNLEDEKTIDLMMQVRNCSYTSFLYSPGKCTLTSFNAVPHLYPDMWTVG
jgi:broad specificity phosphatase PhoE